MVTSPLLRTSTHDGLLALLAWRARVIVVIVVVVVVVVVAAADAADKDGCGRLAIARH